MTDIPAISTMGSEKSMSQHGGIRLPHLISDGMVLQRDADVRIWGWAEPGAAVEVRFAGHALRTVTDGAGQWLVTLQTGGAGGPYELTVQSGEELVTVKDVLLGDVWICSGQSNMDMRVLSVRERYAAEIASSANREIRQFSVPVKFDFMGPLEDSDEATWKSADRQTVLGFSAAAYFFAVKLYERYHVSIGLINASLGGAPAEAFMSEAALAAFPHHLEIARKAKDAAWVDGLLKNNESSLKQWRERVDREDIGTGKECIPFYDPAFDASVWPEIPVPCRWFEQGLGMLNGVVWFRKDIEIPSELAGQPATLLLGNVVDEDTVYLNGTVVGSLPMQYIPRKYEIPAGLLKAGKNTLVVRVVNFSGLGGFYKGKPYRLIIGGQTIDLAGQWQYKIGVASEPLPEPAYVMWFPTGLSNGMIAPVSRYAIKGALWYQGETNCRKPQEYEALLRALIEDWRARWGQGDFPFLIVQLPNYEETFQPASGNWARLREEQRRVLAVPNTAMAVTIDIGEWNDVHPTNKKDVGIRLALAAMKTAYGETDVVASGPLFQSVRCEGSRLVIAFAEAGSGLVTRGSGAPGCFEVAGPDGHFVPAQASIQGDCVTVWNDNVSEPVHARYAWADNPAEANLYNLEGMPASPFTTERFSDT